MRTSPTVVEPAAETHQEVELIPPSPEDAAATAMARRGVLLCRSGQPVARVVEALVDAPRNPLRALRGDLRPGKFVVWDEKLTAYVARKAGHVWLRQNRLEIDDLLELSEDIDGSTGPVTYEGQLTIHRNILDLAVVTAAGNITVHGTIEAAEVHAGGELHVHHGICGKEKGHITAQGRITARFVTNARIAAGGDILISNEVVNSHLTCGSVLKVEQGTILAGHAVALGGITCHTAGSDVGVKTILEAGLAPERYTAIRNTITTAELTRQKAHEIRSAVEPLLARAKTLTAAQKEKATELLYSADEAEARANDALLALEHTKTSLQTSMNTKICVASLLHPGVIVRYPVAEGLVTMPMRGPLEIILRTTGGETHILVIDRCRNTSTPLQSLPGAEGQADIARKILYGPSPTH